MNRKMVIIGAGSAMFTQGLVADLIKNPGRHRWSLALVDIDPQALESIRILCSKMIEARQADIGLTYSTDRRDALPGADYVVSTIGVGGRRAWEQDVFIPRKYGVFQPVGDTAMAGGISRAMRMIPAMLDIARDVERLCPGARFFNFSNPMAVICRAVMKASAYPMAGLCHGVRGTERFLARFAGVDPEDVSSLAVGINHLTFIYDIRHRGEDLKPLLKSKLEEIRKRGIDYSCAGRLFCDDPIEGVSTLEEPFSWEVFDAYGAWPAPGDRHITEFFTECFPGGRYYGKTLGLDAFSFEGTIEYGDRIYESVGRLAHSPDPLPDRFFEHVPGEHEQLMAMINAFEADERKVYSVNLPNRGAVPNLPAYAALEMPAVTGATGFRPLQIADFPDLLAGIISRHLAVVEAAVDAALAGDRRLMAEAILMGGYISDRAAVQKLTDELIRAHSRYLPQFQ